MASPSFPPLASPSPRAFGTTRSFTLPTRLSDTRPPSFPAKPSGGDIETLFDSPKCKIVSFAPALPTERSRAVSITSGRSTPLPVGELACGTKTERTIALGPLSVYRVPGSVAFLNSGKLVHPVLPKSSCWCVDGKTQFVLGVPGGKYYRIELPCENEEDQIRADEFKIVLAKICLYETTACPFKRGFYVELPDASAVTPKRPWKPKHEPGVSSPWSPEGQQLVDGVRIERTFPSTVRGLSQSPRRPYQARADSAASSDRTSISATSIADNVARSQTPVESKVPKLVATYDDFGAALQEAEKPSLPSRRPSTAADVPSVQESFRAQETTSEAPAEPVPNAYDPQPQAVADSTNLTHIIAENEPALGHDSDNEIEEFPEPASSEASPVEKSSPQHLRLKDSTEGLHWLGIDDHDETPTTTRPHSAIRSVTAPIFTPIQPEKLSLEPVTTTQLPRHDSETESLASVESTASFHSLHSPTSPDSATYALGITTLGSPNSHKRETSSSTVTVAEEVPADLSTPTWPTFSPTTTQDEDAETETESDAKSFTTAAASPPSPPSPNLRHPRSRTTTDSLRLRLSQRRTQSPLPPQANIYIPSPTFSGHLREMILNKTASLLLGPPVQLVALMLNLARKFADGNLKGDSYTLGVHGQPIPCDWLDSDGEESEEDDYGISIGGTPERRRRRSERDRPVSGVD